MIKEAFQITWYFLTLPFNAVNTMTEGDIPAKIFFMTLLGMVYVTGIIAISWGFRGGNKKTSEKDDKINKGNKTK